MAYWQRVLLAAMASRTISVFPLYFVGGFSILIRDDLPFTEVQLGTAVATFYASYALASIPVGWAGDRLSARASLHVGVIIGCVCLALIAVAQSWTHIAIVMPIAGIASAFTQPGANVAIYEAVSRRRQGLAFGLKQASVPIASFMVGLSIPVVGLTLGWRAAFLIGVASFIPYLIITPKIPVSRITAAARKLRVKFRPSGALILLTVAAGLASGAINCLAPFYVASVTAHGTTTAVAGILLAVGGASAFVSRIGWGWLSDRTDGNVMRTTIILLFVGSVGFSLLMFDVGVPLLVVATLLAFGAGSGWSGLYHLAIIRHHPDSPGAATGMTAAGLAIGGVVGPALFGLLVRPDNFMPAWAATGGLMLASAILAVIGARYLRPPEVRNAPQQEETLQ